MSAYGEAIMDTKPRIPLPLIHSVQIFSNIEIRNPAHFMVFCGKHLPKGIVEYNETIRVVFSHHCAAFRS